MCWQDSCPGFYQYSCNLICTTDKSSCADLNKDIGMSSLDLALTMSEFALNPAGLIDFFSSASGFASSLMNDGNIYLVI